MYLEQKLNFVLSKESTPLWSTGMYMGDLVRKMVSDMTDQGLLLCGRLSRGMSSAGALRAEHLCRVESDTRGTYAAGRAVLTEALGAHDPTDFDCELFRYACECVTKRSAHLVAAGLAGLLQRLGPGADAATAVDSAPVDTVIVAAAGAVFDAHPKYASMVTCKARELIDDRVPFTVLKASGSTGRGARAVASILAGIALSGP